MKSLGIPFEERLVPFGKEQGSIPFHTFSPTGRVPCLVDEGLTIWDSLAITEYLAESWSTVWPGDKHARAWARCACAEMHSGFHHLRQVCAMNCGLRVELFEQSPSLLAEWARIDELWREGLQSFGGPFLTGEQFCAVDAFFAPVAFRVQTYAPSLSAPSLAYSHRLLNRPHMQEWYAAALAETWRDDMHETETRAVGHWVQDLRARPA